MKKRTYTDRRMAAAGDDSIDIGHQTEDGFNKETDRSQAQVGEVAPMAQVRSMRAAEPVLGVGQGGSSPLSNFSASSAVVDNEDKMGQYQVYDVGMKQVLQHCARVGIRVSSDPVTDPNQQVELIATFGRNSHAIVGSRMGLVTRASLQPEMLTDVPLYYKSEDGSNATGLNACQMEQISQDIYRLTIDRTQLQDLDGKTFTNMLLEIGFARRDTVSGELSYLGKCLAFFPTEYRKMAFYLVLK